MKGIRLLAVVVGVALGCSARAGDLQIKDEARALWKQAMDHHKSNDPARAMDAFLKAYHVDPAVLALESGGLLDSTIQYVKSQLDVKKDDLQYTFKLAELYNLRGELPKAITCYQRVTQLAPTSPLAQVAADEAKKLQGFQSVLNPSPPAASASPDPGKADYEKYAKGQKDPKGQKIEQAEAKVKELEEALKRQKEEYSELKGQLDKLQEDHDKLQEQYAKAKYYETLYFANPANMQLLRKGQIK
ncbi:MAG: hypothetical protein HY815_32925 [Candidatus Riflebacteria bacterium]|nr:hypothetical protein [Candidatus Riflebacteria bacterium]